MASDVDAVIAAQPAPKHDVVMKDPFNLQRFVDAQSGVIDQVCSELRAGRKA